MRTIDLCNLIIGWCEEDAKIESKKENVRSVLGAVTSCLDPGTELDAIAEVVLVAEEVLQDDRNG